MLDRLDLPAAERAKVEAQIAARIPPLSAEETAEEARQSAAFLSVFRWPPPAGLAALVRVWNTTSESERAEFLDLLRQHQVI